METLTELFEARQAKLENGPWYPAAGGTEEPFWTASGRRLQYCFQPSTGRHAYLDCQTDLILSHEEAELAMAFR